MSRIADATCFEAPSINLRKLVEATIVLGVSTVILLILTIEASLSSTFASINSALLMPSNASQSKDMAYHSHNNYLVDHSWQQLSHGKNL